jgi:hypothetical protein
MEKSSRKTKPRAMLFLSNAILLMIVFSLQPATVSAAIQATFYVSPLGNDLNAGTQAAPFNTLAKARDAVRAVNANMTGDIAVNLLDGWYVLTGTLNIDQTCSGTGVNNVIFQAAQGAHAVISGGRSITGWTLHDVAKNIWQASAPGLNTRQLYVNCVRAIRAHKGAVLPGAVKTSSGYTTTDNTMQSWRNPGDIEFVFNGRVINQTQNAGARNWVENRFGVASISGTTITMKTGWNGQAGNPTDIENAYELLDQPGEWYLDRSAGVVYYIPRPGEELSKAKVVAAVLDGTLISVQGTLAAPVHNIQFKGITFAHTTWLRPNTSGFLELQANYESGFGFPPAAVSVKAGQAVRFERCIFKHLGGMGLAFSGGSHDCAAAGCVFTEISGNCLNIGDVNDPARSDARARDSGDQAVDCYIHDSPCEYHGGINIFAGYVSDVLISHNYIENTPYTPISVGWGWGTNSYAQNNQVSYNDLSNYAQQLTDVGAIYSLSAQPNFAWHHNYAHDIPNATGSLYRAWFTDEGSAYIDLHHNVNARIASGNWYSAWTNSIHDIQIHDNFTDTRNYENHGVNCIMTNNTVVTNNNWPQAALDIMNGAGIESSWADVKTLRCACSFDNSTRAINRGNKVIGSQNRRNVGIYTLKGQFLVCAPSKDGAGRMLVQGHRLPAGTYLMQEVTTTGMKLSRKLVLP